MTGGLATKTAWNTLTAAFTTISRFASIMILARMITKAEVGMYSYVLWLLGVFFSILSVGMPASIVRYIAQYRGEQNESNVEQLKAWYARFQWKVSLFILLFILSFSLYRPAYSFGEVSLLFFCALLLIQVFAQFYLSVLTGEQRFQTLFYMSAYTSSVLVLGTFLGCLFGGLNGALLGSALSSLLPSCLGIYFVVRHTPRNILPKEERKKIYGYTLYSWLNALLLTFVWSRTELFFLDLWHTKNEMADFSVASNLAGVVYNIGAMLSGALIPHFSEIYGKRGIEGVKDVYLPTSKLFFFLIAPVGLGGAAVAPFLLRVLYGEQYVSAIPTAMFLSMTALFIASSPIIASLSAAGDSKSYFLAHVAGSLCFVPFAFLLIPAWGSLGASLVKFFSLFVTNALLAFFLFRQTALPFRIRMYAQILCSAFLSCAVAFVITVHWPNWFGFAFSVGSACVLYAFMIRFFSILQQEDFVRLLPLLRKLGSLRPQTERALRWICRTPQSTEQSTTL